MNTGKIRANNFIAYLNESTVDALELQSGTAFKDLIRSDGQITTFNFSTFTNIIAYVNFTAVQSIPVAINTLTNMFAASYGLNTTVKLTSQVRSFGPPMNKTKTN